MHPIPLTERDRRDLPPHELVTYAEHQPEYLPLPGARCAGPEALFVTRFHPTDDERRALAAGEDLYLEVYTFGYPLQPIRLTVGRPSTP